MTKRQNNKQIDSTAFSVAMRQNNETAKTDPRPEPYSVGGL